ncbi:hypothetical protein ACFQQL_04170 [Georgenia alba]|uniref:Uncharacterized protein n=1 Tax=Georgenia alba TaxID=2233858 RepID=A0ABW2Q9P3_9MICO
MRRRCSSPDDLAACVALHPTGGPLDPEPARRYVIGMNLGLKNDRTVLAVCHGEPAPPAPDSPPGRPSSPRVVLDRLHVLAGRRDAPVSLTDVEAVAYEAATAYRAPIRLDPWQATRWSRARGTTSRARGRATGSGEGRRTPAGGIPVENVSGRLHASRNHQ